MQGSDEMWMDTMGLQNPNIFTCLATLDIFMDDNYN